MRFSLLLAVILAASGVAGMAQNTTYKPTKVKPSHDTSEKRKPASAAAPKETKSGQNSAAQQLRRAEAEGAKTGSKRTQAKQQKTGLAKMPHDKPAPPIRVSAKGGSSSMTNRGANPYKGRLRQKGANHHR